MRAFPIARSVLPVLSLALCLALATASLVLGTDKAHAQTIEEGGQIASFQVQGNQRVEVESVISRTGLAEGDPFSSQLLDSALKALFETNLFRDVRFEREGNQLIIIVEENPVISRIAFEGNDRVDDNTLASEVPLAERDVFTPTAVRRALDRLNLIYRRRGFYEVQINPQTIARDQNRVDLVFEINEGNPIQILSIDFIGNDAYSDNRLRRIILTRPKAWFRFLSSSDIYDPERLSVDRELLGRFYRGEGYPEFQVISATAEYLPTRNGFAVTFVVEEGVQYDFGAVTVTAESGDIEAEPLKKFLAAKQGKRYDEGILDEDVEALQEEVGSFGYAFVQVDYETDLDRDRREVNVEYRIEEGAEIYVERIDIEGNLRTEDKVVRREFRISEGSPYDRAAVRLSQKKIRDLGYFRSLNLEEEEGTTPEQVVLKTQVEEQSTGGLFFGAAYSTTTKFSAKARITENNLLGTGRKIALSTSLGSTSDDIDFSYTQPWFLGRPLLVGGDVFRVKTDFDSSGYNRIRTGFAARAGYDINDYTRHVIRYTLRQTRIDVKDEGKLPSSIKDEDRSTYRSGISQTITYDRRDDRFNPTEGEVIELFNDTVGLGGDIRYVRSTISGAKYWPIRRNRARPAKSVFQARAEAGHINGIGQKTTSSDRFYLGGSSFRGFDFYGLGPRDVSSNAAIGGKYYYKSTLQVDFPIGFSEELDIRGFVFGDAGSVFGHDAAKTKAKGGDGEDKDEQIPAVHDSRNLRAAIGGGFFWRSPLGPLSFNWSRALRKEKFDVTENFLFTIGGEF